MQPKREKLLVAIVAGSSDAWASKIACFLSRKGVDVLYVGGRDPGCNVIRAGKIPGRANFLSTISTAHAGINYDIHLGGSNVKKYDYALAGLAIFSGGTGVRGDFLPGEAAFADEYDLLAKLSGYTVEELEYMGRRNRDHAIREFEEALRRLQERVEQLL
ncbi:MAG: hypothetical protein LRS49_05355 [Desulfurococcales archaeon]|nr:hypothetical protein [Desulfurococcales archaeon]